MGGVFQQRRSRRQSRFCTRNHTNHTKLRSTFTKQFPQSIKFKSIFSRKAGTKEVGQSIKSTFSRKAGTKKIKLTKITKQVRQSIKFKSIKVTKITKQVRQSIKLNSILNRDKLPQGGYQRIETNQIEAGSEPWLVYFNR